MRLVDGLDFYQRAALKYTSISIEDIERELEEESERDEEETDFTDEIYD